MSCVLSPYNSTTGTLACLLYAGRVTVKGTIMRTEEEIRQHLDDLRQLALELRTELDTMKEQGFMTPDKEHAYENLAEHKVQLDRDRTMLEWVLGEDSIDPTLPTSQDLRIDNLTLNELETALEEMGIPKEARDEIVQSEKMRRESPG